MLIAETLYESQQISRNPMFIMGFRSGDRIELYGHRTIPGLIRLETVFCTVPNKCKYVSWRLMCAKIFNLTHLYLLQGLESGFTPLTPESFARFVWGTE